MSWGSGSGIPSDFVDFLKALAAADPPGPEALIARNFLMDENVVSEQAQLYREMGVAARQSGFAAWSGGHERFLNKYVYPKSPPDESKWSLDPTDEDECSVTFRCLASGDRVVRLDLGVLLVHVVPVSIFANLAGLDARFVVERVRSALGQADQAQVADLQALLDRWNAEATPRPVFAALFREVADGEEGEALFGADPAHDLADWPDRLRDRLGLLHLDPSSMGPIDVLVFRYPVRAVPRMRGLANDLRPLACPSVLDGSFNAAFCPSPRELTEGHSVDLDWASRSRLPRTEVVHPMGRLSAEHLFRFGTIQRPVTDAMRENRCFHLMEIQEFADRPNYGVDTDEDLLT